MTGYAERLEAEVALAVGEVARWTEELDAIVERIGVHFSHLRVIERACSYLQGLLSPLERKNSWQVAESGGEVTPSRMQNLLHRSIWNQDGVRDELASYVAEQLGDRQAVGVLDESAMLKKGAKSAGVARQYCGLTGQVENCQVGVFLGYASPKGHALIDRELYLPEAWTGDADRCRAAHVPTTVKFATKPQLALRMWQRARDAGIEFPWVTADEVYGRDPALRHAPTRPCMPSGSGPPVAQSISSTGCTTGIVVPAAICVMQPMLPAAITSGAVVSIFLILRSRNRNAMSGCRML